MRPSQALLSLLLCTTLSSAWPWPPTFPENRAIARRQDDGNTPTSTQQSATDNASSTTDSPSSSDSAAATSQTDGESSTGPITKGPTQTGSQSGKQTDKPASKTGKHPNIDPQDPPGGISMLTPSAGQTTYYKIGETITFGWNYTSLQATPTRINVLATNTAGTWTLANNQSYKATGKVVWDTNKDKSDAQNPLGMDTYTLVVYDADTNPTAAPSPGYLHADNLFRFGMYSPAPYTPLDNFVCATCNGGIAAMERQTLKFIFGMGFITVLSFTWFVGGFLGAL